MSAPVLKVVPAYWASTAIGHSVPFVVSLLLFDREQKPRLAPAVEASINRTVDATGREGLATVTVMDADDLSKTLGRAMARAIVMPGVIVLVRCQSAKGAEHVMNWLHNAYTLSLVRDAQTGCLTGGAALKPQTEG